MTLHDAFLYLLTTGELAPYETVANPYISLYVAYNYACKVGKHYWLHSQRTERTDVAKTVSTFYRIRMYVFLS